MPTPPVHPPIPPFRPEAVVFDLDGLLVDSEGRWGEAERAVVAGYGRPWDESVRTQLLGKGPADAAAALALHLGVDDEEQVRVRLFAEAGAAFDRGIPVRPGAADLVAALHGRVPIGVATNSVRVLAERALRSAGLAPFFSTVVSVEDVALPKPAPDPYATACERLGADPTRSVGLEDSPVGMRAARAAGMWVVACPSFPGQPTGDADAVVGALTDIDPERLLQGRTARAS